MTTIQIFLSYASEDRSLVDNLYNRLSEKGYKPWMDHRDMLPGEQWEYKIKKALSQSHFFIACLTNNSVNKRGWIQKELKTARDNWQFKLDDDIYFIPVYLEKCPLPESISAFQSVHYYEKDGWSKLLKSLETGAERLGISIEQKDKPGVCAATVEERHFWHPS